MRIKILLLLFITALLWGASPIIEKIGLTSTDPILGIAVRSFTVSSLLIIFLLLSGKIHSLFSLSFKSTALFACSGIMAGLLGMWCYFSALKLGATSKVVPIAATYPMVTAVLAITLLKEEFSLSKVIGTLLIVIGILLVK